MAWNSTKVGTDPEKVLGVGIGKLNVAGDPCKHGTMVFYHPTYIVVTSKDVAIVLGISEAVSHGDSGLVIEDEKETHREIRIIATDFLD